MQENQKLKGIIPPLATPLDDQYNLDHVGLHKLLKHVIDGGVHGLFILGTTGEALSLTYATRLKMVEQVVEEVGGQLPVLVGVSDTSLEEAIQFSQKAEKAGANAVVIAPPYYFPNQQQSLYDYVAQLTEAIEIPAYIYNIPSHSPHMFSHETVKKLLELPKVAGYKDSTCSMMAYHQLKTKLGDSFDKTYLLGPEELLGESVLFGADGGVNGGANAFPRLYVSMYEAALSADMDKIRKLQKQIMQISLNLYQEGKTVIQGVKYALSYMDICQPHVALPLTNLTQSEKDKMREFLNSFELAL